MPLVRIHCLPVEALDIGLAVRGVTGALVAATDVAPENISVVWNELSPDSYAHRGDLAEAASATGHPVIVDLIAPDFHRPHIVQLMMKTLANEVGAISGAGTNNVLVIHQPLGSGHVYDAGNLVNW